MGYDCSFLEDLGVASTTSDAERDHHAADWGAEAFELGVTPDAVVWPESTDEVSRLLSACTERGVPVTPYAAGTSLEGNAVPAQKGVSMDMTRMNSVLAIRPEAFQIDVEPGVMGHEINDRVAEHGLFFPPMPASADISTIGGMIANDASGMKTVKYGEVGDWVLELQGVLADGSVITTGSRAVKTSSGYNLRDLLIGSEGTLAVITRATLELANRPEEIRGGRAVFPTLEEATESVRQVIQAGVDVATLELIDSTSACIANAYLDTSLPDAPMVFLEIHSTHEETITREIERCHSCFTDRVDRFETALSGERMEELWKARTELAFAMQVNDPVRKPLHPGDITVPIDSYPEIIRYAKECGEETGLSVPCFGHAGDGNVHYSVLVDRDDPDELARGEECYRKIVERAIELGGTATGEHGIGMGKREYMILEHGEETVGMMRAMKRAFDPTETLNPGKIFPEPSGSERVSTDTDDS